MGYLWPVVQTLCPDGTHRVGTAPNAASSFRALPRALRRRIVQMLCDIAEVAELAPTAVDFHGTQELLRLRAGNVVVLYSLDAQNGILLQHVVDADSLPERLNCAS